MTGTTMIAPAAYAQYTTRKGNNYTSDANKYIFNVGNGDVLSLIDLGCKVGASPTINGLPWVTGRFYGVPQGVTPVALLTVASVLYAYPFFVPNPVTLAALQVSVTTGQTGGKVEAGIYADNGAGYPGALVAGTDTGDLAGTATAVVGPTNLAIVLASGWYWAAVQAAATSTMPSVAGGTVSYAAAMGALLGSDTAADLLAAGSQAVGGIKKTSLTYAALTAAFPTGAVEVLNAGVPMVSLGV